MTDDSLYGAAVDAAYGRAGFGAAVPRGSRPVLIVVDLTRGFTEPGFASGADLTRQVAAADRLVAAAHAAGVPVVHTAISYTPAEVEGDTVAWLRKAPGLRTLLDGSDAVVLDPRIGRAEGDTTIVKKAASAFHDTELAALLTDLGATNAVVCGATTSGCVRATAVDAVSNGFDTLVVAEACGDRDDAPHRAALFDLQAKYADVIDLDDAVDYLSRTGRP